MKKILIVSVVINTFSFIISAYVIGEKEGIYCFNRNLQAKYSNHMPQNNFGVYYAVQKQLFESLPNEKIKIIFLGNSITEAFDWVERFKNAHKILPWLKGYYLKICFCI